eukprot:131709_1
MTSSGTLPKKGKFKQLTFPELNALYNSLNAARTSGNVHPKPPSVHAKSTNGSKKSGPPPTRTVIDLVSAVPPPTVTNTSKFAQQMSLLKLRRTPFKKLQNLPEYAKPPTSMESIEDSDTFHSWLKWAKPQWRTVRERKYRLDPTRKRVRPPQTVSPPRAHPHRPPKKPKFGKENAHKSRSALKSAFSRVGRSYLFGMEPPALPADTSLPDWPASRPPPARTLSVWLDLPAGSVCGVLEAWDFLHAFSEPLRFSNRVSLEDFATALKRNSPSMLLHSVLVSLVSCVMTFPRDSDGSLHGQVVSILTWQHHLAKWLSAQKATLAKCEDGGQESKFALDDVIAVCQAEEFFKLSFERRVATLSFLCEHAYSSRCIKSTFSSRLEYANRAKVETQKKIHTRMKLAKDSLYNDAITTQGVCITLGNLIDKVVKHSELPSPPPKLKPSTDLVDLTTPPLGPVATPVIHHASPSSSSSTSPESTVNHLFDVYVTKELDKAEKDRSNLLAMFRSIIDSRCIRRKPLGCDRFGARYWQLGGSSRAIFVESAEIGEWICYTSRQEFDALLSFLNPKGQAECALIANLKFVEWKFSASDNKDTSRSQEVTFRNVLRSQRSLLRAPVGLDQDDNWFTDFYGNGDSNNVPLELNVLKSLLLRMDVAPEMAFSDPRSTEEKIGSSTSIKSTTTLSGFKQILGDFASSTKTDWRRKWFKLDEWSDQLNSAHRTVDVAVCLLAFDRALLYTAKQFETSNSKHFRKKYKKRTDQLPEPIENACQICEADDNPNDLMMCDMCNLEYHMGCLSLSRFPRGAWSCPRCESARNVIVNGRSKKLPPTPAKGTAEPEKAGAEGKSEAEPSSSAETPDIFRFPKLSGGTVVPEEFDLPLALMDSDSEDAATELSSLDSDSSLSDFERSCCHVCHKEEEQEKGKEEGKEEEKEEEKADDKGEMLACHSCGTRYHQKCLEPPESRPQFGSRFICEKCSQLQPADKDFPIIFSLLDPFSDDCGTVDMATQSHSACGVCGLGPTDTQSDNQLISCSGICGGTAVHTKCSQLNVFPGGDWVCDKCAECVDNVSCMFCPRSDGVFHRAPSGRWSHAACAVWIPGVCLKTDKRRIEVLVDENEMLYSDQETCEICIQDDGFSIRCYEPGCPSAYHASCLVLSGRSKGYRIELPDRYSRSTPKSWCRKHSLVARS